MCMVTQVETHAMEALHGAINLAVLELTYSEHKLPVHYLFLLWHVYGNLTPPHTNLPGCLSCQDDGVLWVLQLLQAAQPDTSATRWT